MKKINKILISLFVVFASSCKENDVKSYNSATDTNNNQISESNTISSKELLVPKKYEFAGTFYSLKDSYDNLVIDQNDLLNIAYYYKSSGNLVYDNNKNKIEFNNDDITEIDELGDEKENIIVTDYFYKLISDESEEYIEKHFDEFKQSFSKLKLNYLGIYHNYIACYFDGESAFNGYSTTVEEEVIGDYIFEHSMIGYKHIYLWLEK